jgi:hypothetical protein
MDSIQGAVKARDFYLHFDKGEQRRNDLGGTSLEINLLTEPQEAGNSYSIIKPNINKYLGDPMSGYSDPGKSNVGLIEGLSGRVFYELQGLENKSKNILLNGNNETSNNIKCGNDFMNDDNFNLEWSGILSCNNPHSKLVIDCFRINTFSQNSLSPGIFIFNDF